MAKEETFSHVVRLGGLPPRVINRYVATVAAINVAPPGELGEVEDFVRHFLRWLENADDEHEDRELRRGVLLAVTRGLQRHGLSGNEDAARVTKLVEEYYTNLA